MTQWRHLPLRLCKHHAVTKEGVLKVFKVWMAASCLLLTGCRPELAWKEFAVLSFSDSPRGLYMQSYSADNKRYARRLTADLEKLGLRAADLKIEADADYRSALYVSIRQRAFTPEQRRIIRAYLIGILEAREQANIEMKLTLRVGLNPALASTRRRPFDESYVRLAPMRLRPPFQIEVLNAETGQSWRSGTDQGRALCQVGAIVRMAAPGSFEHFVPLPGSQFQAPHGFVMRIENNVRPGIPAELVLDALVDLQSPSLAHQLDEQGIAPYVKRGQRNAATAGFVIGHLDAPQDKGQPPGAVEDNCARKIAALGRPFSFHVGHSMDRLRYVEFWDQP